MMKPLILSDTEVICLARCMAACECFVYVIALHPLGTFSVFCVTVMWAFFNLVCPFLWLWMCDVSAELHRWRTSIAVIAAIFKALTLFLRFTDTWIKTFYWCHFFGIYVKLLLLRKSLMQLHRKYTVKQQPVWRCFGFYGKSCKKHQISTVDICWNAIRKVLSNSIPITLRGMCFYSKINIPLLIIITIVIIGSDLLC